MRDSADPDGTRTDEAREIGDLIRPAAEEEGFPRFDVTFGEDSTGARAIWISFLSALADAPTAEELQAAARLRKRVGEALFNHGIDRIHYIRFRKALARAR